MQTFAMNIKNRFWVHFDPLLFFDILCKTDLIISFDLLIFFTKFFVRFFVFRSLISERDKEVSR